MLTILAFVAAFVIGCLVGANNPLKTKTVANEVKAEAAALADKAK